MLSQCRSIEERSQDVEAILEKGFEYSNFADLMRLTTPGTVRAVIGIRATHGNALNAFSERVSRMKSRMDPTLVTYI